MSDQQNGVESASCGDLSEYATCQKCARDRVYEDSSLCDKEASSGKLGICLALWNTKPTVSHFRVFGLFVSDHLRRFFDKKAVQCIFAGYDSERVRLPDTKEMEEKLQQKLGELSEDTQSSPQVVEESIPFLSPVKKKKPE